MAAPGAPRDRGRAWRIALGVAMLAVLVAWLSAIRSGPGPKGSDVATPGAAPPPLPVPASPARVGPPPEHPILFLGDSITHYLPERRVDPAAVNGGVGGVDSRWLAQHLQDVPTAHAEFVVLTIGTNDGRLGKFPGLEERYRLISSRIAAPILWNAIPPNAHYDVGPTNALVRKVCSERPDCRYLETPFQYPADFADDGYHLSPAGYERWIASLRAAIAEARAQPRPAASR